jgi:SAM-dependent methyltransferase
MANDDYKLFPCELCASTEFAEIPEARIYTDDQPLHVCKNCGFVQVIRRRPAARIAEIWARELYQSEYTARIPAIKARQVYVAETIDTLIGLRDKRVCDIGAGEGVFLQMLRDDYGADVFGIEPSAANCARMRELNIPCFDGTAEDFQRSAGDNHQSFDIVTIIWTLENSNSCRKLIDVAWALARAEGHVAVATGSRILVPFKKPLNYYLGPNQADTHAFRFSANTLRGLLSVSGFETISTNHYIDSDVLCLVARRTDRSKKLTWAHDDWRRVQEFFTRWHQDTAFYKI